MATKTVIPSDIMRTITEYQGAGIRRILADLRRRGVLRSYNAVDLDDVRAEDRGLLMSMAARAERDRTRDASDSPDSLVWAYLRLRLPIYKKNAATRGIPFSLVTRDLRRAYQRSKGCCEVTGVPFTLEKFEANRAPFAPSIDRINCSEGYQIGNVRLTCQIANLAMNVWGDRVLFAFLERAKVAGILR